MNKAAEGISAAIQFAQAELDRQPVYDLSLHLLFQEFQDMLAEHDRQEAANAMPVLPTGTEQE